MPISSAVIGLALIAGFVSPVFAADSPFLGKWTATAAGQPEAAPGKDIVLQGDHFTYKRTVDIGGNQIVITYSGIVSGDTFSGAIELASVKIPFTGVRIREDG